MISKPKLCKTAEIQKRLTGLLAIVERKHRVQMKLKSVSTKAKANSEICSSPKSISSTPTKGFNSFLSNQEPINCMQYLMELLE